MNCKSPLNLNFRKEMRLALAVCWTFAFLFGFYLTSAQAKNKADIVDVEIERKTGNLEVSFHILNCFTPKMEEAIRSGVPTSFRIRVILEKAGLPLFKSPLLDVALDHTVKYDRIKNEYLVALPEHPDREITTTDFDDAMRLMSTVKDLPVIPLWRLEKEETYQLRLKAELSKIRLPLFFRYIFFFVSLWDFESDWYQTTL